MEIRVTTDHLTVMDQNAGRAARFLKSMAHEGRLKILCHLATGEKPVKELEDLLNSRQAAVSQMLARLRAEELVKTRRQGKTIYYALADPDVAQIIAVLYDRFCDPDTA